MDLQSFIDELVTSDDIPDVLGRWEPVKNRSKKDKLYQKRLKQNPDLKKNIKKIGESLMKTVITFKASNQKIISNQWHKMNTMNQTGTVSWELSNPEVSGKTYMFTLEYYGKDQYLEGERLDNMVYAGVSYNVKQSKNEAVEQQESIVSLIESGDNASLLADILLQEEIEITETNQPDDSEEEVQDVKKSEIGEAEELEENEAKPDYPQYQFAIMLPREDYTAAMRTLNNSNIKAKTKFNAQKDEMAIIGFDKHNGTGDGKPEFTQEEVIDILKDAGIAATKADGIELQKEPETLPVEK
jgi:hypothetical protein